MKGYPKHLNNKQDYLNMLGIDKEETVKRLQNLLDERFSWFQGEKLADGDEGIEDSTHKVVVQQERVENAEEEIEVRYQYELKEDENSTLFRLGFTVAEVKKLMK